MTKREEFIRQMREEFIRQIECPDLKITSVTTDVPKSFHVIGKNQRLVYYAHVEYKDYRFIVQFTFHANIPVDTTNTIYIYTERGRHVNRSYKYTDILTQIENDVNNKKQLKDRKENPDILEVIKQFLKEHGYKTTRQTFRNYDGVMTYLTVNPIRFSVFVTVEKGNIVYKFNHHNGRSHTIPTDFADPNCKAFDTLLTIIKYVSTDFNALEAKLKIEKRGG
jgi:hypothetical protein